MSPILGLHHVTAIAGDPVRNFHFYTRLLGLRLAKVTVNFDDPNSYHLYYGSGTGSPGTIVTFFPWVNAYPGSRSTGETSTIALSIPEGSLDFWKNRLSEEPLAFQAGEGSISFADPDGMRLQLIEAAGLEAVLRWDEGPVPAAHAVHGLHHVVLDIHAPRVAATTRLLEAHLGFAPLTATPDDIAFETNGGGPGRRVHLARQSSVQRGRMGPGIVHHIAWRTENDAEQALWRERLVAAGLYVTPVQDRQYFHSIYFREPGGVLFEIATDNPGFLTDESYAELGSRLKLPPWLEPHRISIEAALPPLPKE
jgi:glyoxalase family protein